MIIMYYRPGFVLQRLNEEVFVSQEAFKATTFIRLFCLERGIVPEMNLSTIKECMKRVTLRDSRGAKEHGIRRGVGKRDSAQYILIALTSGEGAC